jgi:hypothetical protein
MDIEYISDDDSESSQLDDYISIKSNGSETDEDLHQIINYPPLEKHSATKIVSICNEIDLIDKAIDSISEAIYKSKLPSIKPVHKSKIPSFKITTKRLWRATRPRYVSLQ